MSLQLPEEVWAILTQSDGIYELHDSRRKTQSSNRLFEYPKKATRRWPMFHAAMSCRANAISTESPSWFNESRPDSGTSPDVL